MVKIICEDCKRIVTTDNENWEESECSECSGSFVLFGKQNESSEESSDYECDECDKDKREEELIYFENIDCNICKKCIDEVYPRKVETKIEYKEKIIEKPVIQYVKNNGEIYIPKSFNEKTKFD